MAGRSRRRRSVDPAPFECSIVDLASDGRGVARVDGKVVFVSDALPGERVRAQRVGGRRSADEARTLAVLQPGPDRVVPQCAHFGVCGGCVLQHLAPEAQLRFKQKQLEDALVRIGGVSAEVMAEPLTGPLWGYRRRARLGVKYVRAKERTLVGFRERHAPFLADMQRCEVLDARVGTRLTDLGAMIDRLSIRDAIPQIEVTATDRVALVFRMLREPTPQDLEILESFGGAEGFDIWLQPGGLASVRPLRTAPMPRFSADGGERQLSMAPTDFIQVNGELSQAMVRQALDWLALPPGARVLELFAGLGNFTVPLAVGGAQVTAVEGESGLVARGRANCEGLAVDWHVADLFSDSAESLWATRPYDAALLDPPRAGAREVLGLLSARGVQRVLYVSCHPATLARDAGILVHEYGYRLERAGVMDMFPHTAHVESMALFVRSG